MMDRALGGHVRLGEQPLDRRVELEEPVVERRAAASEIGSTADRLILIDPSWNPHRDRVVRWPHVGRWTSVDGIVEADVACLREGRDRIGASGALTLAAARCYDAEHVC